MISIKRFNSIEDIQAVQRLAVKYDADVGLHSLDGKVIVDAKSFIGLFSLDMKNPIQVVCEDENFHKELNKLL